MRFLVSALGIGNSGARVEYEGFGDRTSATPTREVSGACGAISGQWDVTTTVTAAHHGGVGTQGYYLMRVASDCNANIQKLGFNATRFTPDRIQRGGASVRWNGTAWAVEFALQRDASADYTIEFLFGIDTRLSGSWRYTGASFETTGFAGTVVGSRL